MASSLPRSLDGIPDSIRTQIASECQVPVTHVEGVYRCTPIQLAMIDEGRSEAFHFILSFGPTADIDRFCEALACVVAKNTILRTRIVNIGLHGMVQVVVDQTHNTPRMAEGELDCYLLDTRNNNHGMRLGTCLFRSAFYGRVFVATIHHAIMDYWSMTTLMNVDVASAYYGQPVTDRPPFSRFVEYCTQIDEISARSFWAARFRGIPSVFPEVSSDQVIVASAKAPRKITLENLYDRIPSSHMPYYIEAAWALTVAAYLYADSVAYGLVLSGRSSALNGLEYTLGPTIVEVPVQANIQRTGTIDRLIKERASSLRQLQAQPAIWYDVKKIAEISEAAKAASAFKTLLNIRPAMPVIKEDDDVKFERMLWLRGSFPLQLVCSILDDGVMVEPRSDSAILPDHQLQRVLRQFEHVLRQIVFSPAETRVSELDLLSPDDRQQLVEWSTRPAASADVGVATALRAIQEQEACPLLSKDSAESSKSDLRYMSTNSHGTVAPNGFALWLTNPKNINELVPAGAIGEIVVEKRETFIQESRRTIQPRWALDHEGKGNSFFRTGDLAQFRSDGTIHFVGRTENRVKLGGLTIQLEHLEDVIHQSGQVRDCILCTKIVLGRTKVVAVVSLGGSNIFGCKMMEKLGADKQGLVDEKIAAIRIYMNTRISTPAVPTIWHVVQALPYSEQQRVDRVAVHQWLSTV